LGFGPFCVVLDFVPPFSRTGARLVDLRSSASIRDRRIKFSRLTGYLFPGNLMAHPGKLIQTFAAKNWPTSQEAAQKKD